MFCPKCGTEIENENTVCKNCGYDTAELMKQELINTTNETANENFETDVTETRENIVVLEQEEKPIVYVKQEKKSNNAIIAVITAILVIIVAVIIGQSIYRHSDGYNDYKNENYDKLMQYYHYYESIEKYTDYLVEELDTYYDKEYNDNMKILDSIEELEALSTEICDFIDANSSFFDTFDIYTDKSTFKERYDTMLDKINEWYDVNQKPSKYYKTDIRNKSYISSFLLSIKRCLGISDVEEALEKFN